MVFNSPVSLFDEVCRMAVWLVSDVIERMGCVMIGMSVVDLIVSLVG